MTQSLPSRLTERPPARIAESRANRLIICAGMPRAGSTLQYNLVRLLVERHLGGSAGGWQGSFDAFSDAFPEYARPDGPASKPLVIKVHAFDARYAALTDPPLSGHVFYIYRDVRDSLISSAHKFGETADEDTACRAARWVEWAQQWSSLIRVTISRYEHIVREPYHEAMRYAQTLGIHVPSDEVRAIVDACSAERMREQAAAAPTDEPEKYDPEFLVHAAHLRDGNWGQWQRDMSTAQRSVIWNSVGTWLEEHAYPRHRQFVTERIPANISGSPSIDCAPPGVPRLRSGTDPMVQAFQAALVSPDRSGNEDGDGRDSPSQARVFYGDELNILPGELVSAELAIRGYFEEGLTWALIQCLRPGDMFLDVGAHVGYFTVLGARLVGLEGRVEAFEPSPQTAGVLRRNVRDLSQVNVNELAVFSQSGPLVFHDLGTAYAAFNSLHAPRLEDPGVPAASRMLTVQATTLDRFCEERKLIPNFVKIDAESAELDILQGARRILSEDQPIVSVEVGDLGVRGAACSREILEFAGQFGYRTYEYVAGDLFVPHALREHYSHDNLLLVPPARCQPREEHRRPETENARLWYRALKRQAEVMRRLLSDYRALRRRFEHLEGIHRQRVCVDGVLHGAYVRLAWERLGRRYAAVALFGAGKLGRWLVSQVESAKGGPRIVRILDDAAENGSVLGSIPVVRPKPEAWLGVDAVVLATDVPHSPLRERCMEACRSSVPVVDLYESLPGGPFPREEWGKV